MATPTFDTIEAQASYGIGLQVGQQLSESGLQGLLPEALVAGIADRWKVNSRRCRWKPFTARCVKSTNALTPCVASVSRKWPRMARNTWKRTASAKA
ncbi:peptidyl-prolyl cis-trans isomerase [Klebsiella grimontii]|uniref:Peptidyl-prolyl cis-trans isomerase n=1 Tax=Klebsiella grimontii TaxID=2058152 RepID=A0A7H4PBH9_9ENTR|nr:peptidyl-prolyl cis-trans isomerase [Klebsiella grimontii]